MFSGLHNGKAREPLQRATQAAPRAGMWRNADLELQHYVWRQRAAWRAWPRSALRVTLGGEISVYRAYGDIVPTGIDNAGKRVYLAEAGPVPHNPEDGKILSLGWHSDREITAGCRLCVDVKHGRDGELFGLAQGVFGGGDPGSPASPNTGELLRIHRDGSISTIATELNQPTSMQLIGGTAYIVSLAGEIWTVDHVERWHHDWWHHHQEHHR
jgi:hypothetical protein